MKLESRKGPTNFFSKTRWKKHSNQTKASLSQVCTQQLRTQKYMFWIFKKINTFLFFDYFFFHLLLQVTNVILKIHKERHPTPHFSGSKAACVLDHEGRGRGGVSGGDRVTTCQQPCRWPPLGCLACRGLSISSYSLRSVFFFFFSSHFGVVGCWSHSVSRRYSRTSRRFIANQIR